MLFALLAFALMTRAVRQEPVTAASSVAVVHGSTAPRVVPPAIDPEIDSKEVLAVFNAGRAAYNQQDYETAVQSFEQVVRALPNNASAFRYLGLSHSWLENFDDALNALSDARAIEPNSYQLLDGTRR